MDFVVSDRRSLASATTAAVGVGFRNDRGGVGLDGREGVRETYAWCAGGAESAAIAEETRGLGGGTLTIEGRGEIDFHPV